MHAIMKLRVFQFAIFIFQFSFFNALVPIQGGRYLHRGARCCQSSLEMSHVARFVCFPNTGLLHMHRIRHQNNWKKENWKM